MKATLLLAEIEFLTIALVSAFLAYQFYISKNGMLRRLLIIFFCSQFFTVLCSAIYYLALEQFGKEPVPIAWMRIIALMPMSVSLILMLIYILGENRKNK